MENRDDVSSPILVLDRREPSPWQPVGLSRHAVRNGQILANDAHVGRVEQD